MRIRVRLLDTVVEIRTEEESAARLLALLWAPMQPEESAAPDRVYEVARRDDGWVATAGHEVQALHETLWGVTDALRYQMLELCEERLEHFVTLHAAAVARGSSLVLLAGESGAGKTTLTLALLRAGWTYLSDDLAPISIETGLVHPFPKPLGVKDPAMWEALPETFRDAARLPPPGGSFLVPADLWQICDRPLEARALVFPRFCPGTGLEVESLSPARAAAAASAYLRRLDPSTLGVLKRLCAGVESMHLSYGSSDDAIATLGSVAEGGI